MDIEKAFDSLDQDFLSSVLTKFGFGKNIIIWIKIFIKRSTLECYKWLQMAT